MGPVALQVSREAEEGQPFGTSLDEGDEAGEAEEGEEGEEGEEAEEAEEGEEVGALQISTNRIHQLVPWGCCRSQVPPCTSTFRPPSTFLNHEQPPKSFC